MTAAPPTRPAEFPVRASELLTALFQALAAERLQFVVLRNYENLPEDWSNDIDILVGPTDLERAHAVVVRTMQIALSGVPIEIMRRINFRATRVSCADRELQIDIYCQMSRAWIQYADTESILEAHRQAHPLFAVPALYDELLLIAAKELFSYGAIRQRYHERLSGHDLQMAVDAAERILAGRVSESGRALIAKALVDPSITGRPRLRLSAFLKPASALRWAWMRRGAWHVPPIARVNLSPPSF